MADEPIEVRAEAWAAIWAMAGPRVTPGEPDSVVREFGQAALDYFQALKRLEERGAHEVRIDGHPDPVMRLVLLPPDRIGFALGHGADPPSPSPGGEVLPFPFPRKR